MTTDGSVARTVLRRRVSLAGHVRRGDGWPATGGAVRVELAAFGVRRAPIRADGRYVFLDLPPGDVAVSGLDGSGHAIEAQRVTVARIDADAPPMPLEVDLRVHADPAPSPDAPSP